MTPLSSLLFHYKEQRLKIVACSGKGQQLENRVEISLEEGRQDQGILLLFEVKKETKLYRENEMCIHCYHYLKDSSKRWEKNSIQFTFWESKQKNLVKMIFFPTDLTPPTLKHTDQQTACSCLPF